MLTSRDSDVNAREAMGAGGAAWRDAAILVIMGMLLFFWRLGSHDLWPPDEPRFALVAREMWQRGDYGVLSLNDHLYTDKPPLFFWAINAFGRLRGGIDEWAARLPSAAAGLASLLLIHHLGRRLFDRRAGLYGALVFATAQQITERARWASIDMTLGLFVLAAILLLWRARAEPAGWRRDTRWAWILMGLATLAKGPVGLVLPLLAVLPAIVIQRDGPAVRRVFAPSGILLYLAVTLSWFGTFARRLGAGFAFHVLVHQNVERYVDAWNSQHPVWYYLWRFPVGFLPWTLLLPWAVAQAFAPEEAGRRRHAVFLATWFLAIFVFFSLSTGKRGVYIIPLYPAAALLIGRLLARASERGLEEDREARRRLRVPLGLWIGFGALLTAGLPFAARGVFRPLLPAALGIGVAFLAGGAAAFLLARRGGAGAPACLFGSTLLALLLVIGGIVPFVNRYQNIRGFAEEVRRHLEPGVPFGTTEQKRDAWVFYTGRFAEALDTRESLLDYLKRDGPHDLLMEGAKLRDIGPSIPAGVETILRGRVGGQDYVLLRRAPAP